MAFNASKEWHSSDPTSSDTNLRSHGQGETLTVWKDIVSTLGSQAWNQQEADPLGAEVGVAYGTAVKVDGWADGLQSCLSWDYKDGEPLHVSCRDPKPKQDSAWAQSELQKQGWHLGDKTWPPTSYTL